MNFDAPSFRVLRPVLVTILVIVLMGIAGDLLKPIAIAVLLAFILAPFVRLFERLHLPRVVGIVITLTLVFSLVGLSGYFVSRQFLDLAAELPNYESNILKKVSALRPGPDSPIEKATRVAERVNDALGTEKPKVFTPEVRVVEESGFLDRFRMVMDPFKEFAGWCGAVLLLLVFLLMYQDEVDDRIIQLAGRNQISLTSKTTNLIAKRLSRYFTAFALFNVGFGTTMGVILYFMGLPYAALWGALAAVLRFIPYLGPALAFSLPVVFSFAHDPGWMRPLMVLGVYGLAEIVANSLEPIVYGRTIGVSSLGLLVSAMFWTWLWGGLGLFLATPLTVCLVVAGKHIPSLSFLHTLLGEGIQVDDDLRFYQRLQSRDLEGAIALLDQAMERKSFGTVCDQIVIPALSRTDKDRASGVLELSDVVFHWRVIQEWLDDLTENNGLSLGSAAEQQATDSTAEEFQVVAIAPDGVAEVLVLRMVELLLKGSRVNLEIIEALGTPLVISQKVAEHKPQAVLLSHVPPIGLTRARYLLKRLHAALPGTTLVVGHWDRTANLNELQEQLQSVSVYHVIQTVSEAPKRLLALAPSDDGRNHQQELTPHAPASGMKPAPV